jgi:ubiquinone/menaquinone biosynthesis C-methylase UbiE
MGPFDPHSIARTYSSVAHDYAAAFADDLQRLPLDRQVLDRAASRVAHGGIVVEVGCGPAQVSAYLGARGVRAVGVDLALGMLHAAQQRNEGIPLAAADMRALPCASGSCAGAVFFYSLHHVPRADIAAVLTEVRRALLPEGVLVVATHVGEGELYGPPEWYGKTVEPLGGTLHAEPELRALLETCGFHVDEMQRRKNLPHEVSTERLYVTATATA